MSALDKSIAEYFGKRAVTKGVFGVEIEAESASAGRPLPPYPASKYWTPHADGSLRNGAEYVFASPLSMVDSLAALAEFKLVTKDWKFREDTIRTSVHIHYNVSQYTLREYYSACFAYWAIENLLVHLHGPHREGNLFCLRFKDAEYIFQNLLTEFSTEAYFQFIRDDHFRYAALNMLATRRYSSLEFRFFKGTTDTDEILVWLRQLDHMMSRAKTIGDPLKILDMYQTLGSEGVVRHFLTDEVYQRVLKEIGPHYPLKCDENYCYLMALGAAMRSSIPFRKPSIIHKVEDLSPDSFREGNKKLKRLVGEPIEVPQWGEREPVNPFDEPQWDAIPDPAPEVAGQVVNGRLERQPRFVNFVVNNVPAQPQLNDRPRAAEEIEALQRLMNQQNLNFDIGGR